MSDAMSAPNVDVERVVTRLVELTAKISDLQAEAEGLKAELRDSLLPGEYEAGGSTFKIVPTRKFSPDLATSMVDPSVVQACLEVVINPAKLKANLTPVQLEECMVVSGKAKVVL